MRARDIYGLIRDKMEATEREIRRELRSDFPIVAQMGAYIAESGGKRIRPALLCLSAAACGYRGDRDVRYGVVFEFVHTATLIHDDIIDKAEMRRGRPVMHDRFGTTLSILFGDLLFNTGMYIALRYDDLRILRLISGATARMIEGEIVQSERNYSIDLCLEDYMDLIRRKTAYLFSCCAQAGAMLAAADEETEKALAGYGLDLGIAFQLIDDYFDYSSNPEWIGKPVGSDLDEGKVTYPLLVLLERAGGKARQLVLGIFERRGATDRELKELLRLLDEHEALQETVASARRYASRAIETAAALPPSEYKKALEELPVFVVERDK